LGKGALPRHRRVVGESRAAIHRRPVACRSAPEKSGVPALLLRRSLGPRKACAPRAGGVASAPSPSTPGLADLGGPRWRVELRRNRFGTPAAA